MNKFVISLILLLSFAVDARADMLSEAKTQLEAEIQKRVELDFPEARLEINILKNKMQLQESQAQNLEITSLELDAEAKRFVGFVVANNGAEKFEISGNYDEIVEVPALSRKFSSDEVISEEDIVYTEISAKKIARGYVVDAKDLIGKSPVRNISANQPVFLKAVKAKNLVQEKKTVTIFYKNDFIEMQDVGIAMESGAEGDLIRVKNATSEIIVSGRVVGDGLVEVMPRGAIIASR